MAETVMRVAAGVSWALRCSKREEEGGGTSRRRRHFFAKIGIVVLYGYPSLHVAPITFCALGRALFHYTAKVCVSRCVFSLFPSPALIRDALN